MKFNVHGNFSVDVYAEVEAASLDAARELVNQITAVERSGTTCHGDSVGLDCPNGVMFMSLSTGPIGDVEWASTDVIDCQPIADD